MDMTKQKNLKKSITARRREFLKAFVENHFNISAACRVVNINRKTFYDWCRKSSKFQQQFDELLEARGDEVEAALIKNAVDHKDTIAQIFYCKTKLKKRGYIEGNSVDVGEKPNAKAVELLDALITGEKNVKTVALEFEKEGIPLLESVRLLLSKEPPEETIDEDDGKVFTDEELEEMYLEGKAKSEGQEEGFVPLRQEEVKQLKEELADQDSFADEEAQK